MRVIDGDGEKLEADIKQEFLKMVTAGTDEESEQAKQKLLDLSRRQKSRGTLTLVKRPSSGACSER